MCDKGAMKMQNTDEMGKIRINNLLTIFPIGLMTDWG